MVLTLRELQGLSSASIAHVMGISQSAVETLLHRARRRFKELFLRQEGTTEASGDCATAPQSSRTAGDATSARDG
jgi:predicted transcriptional regulator